MGLSPTTPPRFTITGMAYNHTQPGRWHYVLFAVALATCVDAWQASSDAAVTGTFIVNLKEDIP